MQNNPNIPNGFIIDHFETDDDVVPEYIVVDKDVFSQLLLNNVAIMRQHEKDVKGIVAADPSSPPRPQRQNHEAEPADMNIIAARQKEMEQIAEKNQADVELFKQFMAWKASQGSNS